MSKIITIGREYGSGGHKVYFDSSQFQSLNEVADKIMERI